MKWNVDKSTCFFMCMGFGFAILDNRLKIFDFFEGIIFYFLLTVLIAIFLANFTNFFDDSDDEES